MSKKKRVITLADEIMVKWPTLLLVVFKLQILSSVTGTAQSSMTDYC